RSCLVLRLRHRPHARSASARPRSSRPFRRDASVAMAEAYDDGGSQRSSCRTSPSRRERFHNSHRRHDARASTWKEAERELASVIQEFERLLRPPPSPLAALTDQVLDQDLADRLARRSLRQMRTMNAAAIDAFPSEHAGEAAVDHRRWAL